MGTDMYSMKLEGNIAKARVEEVDVSFKDLTQVCRNITGKPAAYALSFLEDVYMGKRAVRFFTSNKHMGHRRELGGKPGKYPHKAAKIVMNVLINALSNARTKKLAEDKLIVAHAAANKKRTYPRMQPKGRRTRHNYSTSRVEIILKEVEMQAEKKEKAATGKKESIKKETVAQKAKETKEVKEVAKHGHEKH